MATYCVDSSPAAGVPGEVHTTKLNQLGIERRFSDGSSNWTYVYLEGCTSLAANEYVTYTAGGVAIRLVTTHIGPVAIASAAPTAAQYAWFGIIGSFTGVSESSNLSNVPQYPLSAGRVDDAIVQNKCISGVYATAAAASGATHVVTINRPWVGDMGNSS